MCGFAGVWREHEIVDAQTCASRLDAALAHRGPDGSGRALEDDGRLLLVHRRLAIIDVSAAGAQPMRSRDGRHVLVFNGEIYNYRALRAELERDGATFTTNSDTEVVLTLLIQRGRTALDQLRGMFALAWWNSADRTLLIARDRFGIKPLYLHARRGLIAFASEIRALLAAELVPRRPSPAGVRAFLQWGSIPAPLTWVHSVSAVQPGEWRQWDANGVMHSGRFADARTLWVTRERCDASDDAFVADTHTAVADSIAAHLVADVPVGAFLSGGLDSAVVAAMASRDGVDLRTFTVTFDDVGSEAEEARQTADAIGTTHHELHLDGAEIARDYSSLIAHLDAPTIDGVNSYYVAKAVADTGVKAVLSGLGGDELFGGYPSFVRFSRASTLSQFSRPALVGAAYAWSATRAATAERWRHLATHAGNQLEHYRALRGLFMPAEISTLAGPQLRDTDAAAAADAVDVERLTAAGPESIHAAVSRMETTAYMSTQLLRDSDATSMAHGLEVRVPFVDHELIGSVWPELGRRPHLLRRKRLLGLAAPMAVPQDVVRRRKRGFILPLERWMRGPLATHVRDGLAALESQHWIRDQAAQEIWTEWQQGRMHWTRPWGLSVLGRICSGA